MLLLEDEDVTSPLAELIAEAERIEVFPAVAVELRRVASNPRTSARDLEAVINRDPALMAKVIRVANAPYYGCRRTIATLRHAVTVIGFKDAATLAMGLAIADGDDEDEVGAAMWRHGLYVAALARELSTLTRALEPAEAFVAGILHDIGAIVLRKVYPDLWRGLHPTGSATDAAGLARERAAFGTDHAELGEACLAAWRFSRSTTLSVRHHHAPLTYAGCDGRPAFCGDALLYAADQACRGIAAERPVEEIARRLAADPCVASLELQADDLVAAINTARVDAVAML